MKVKPYKPLGNRVKPQNKAIRGTKKQQIEKYIKQLFNATK